MTARSEPSAAPAPEGSGRFAALSRPLATLVVAVTVILILAGLPYAFHPAPAAPPAHAVNGFTLYGRIIDRMRAGEPYESAAVSELRAEGGPLKPFVTVRPPWLAESLSRLPDPASRDRALEVLALAAVIAWTLRLRTCAQSPLWMGFAALAVFTGAGAGMVGAGSMGLFHEAWAGVLIALSLALRSDRRFVASVLVGLLAGLVRELALPYLLVMALAAFVERRRMEGAAFTAALGLALAALAWHAAQVMALTRPTDFVSPGWIEFAGWGFVLLAAKWNLIVMAFGLWAAALVVPLALLGAIGRGDGLGLRLALLLTGYCLGFMVIGRPANVYWGLVTAPIMSVGLALAPLALVDLFRVARRA
jgi:hypothetical protein